MGESVSSYVRTLGLVLGISLAGPQLKATTINLLPLSNAAGHIGDGSALSTNAMGALQRAALRWESILGDPIILGVTRSLTINLWVDFETLSPGVLANASPRVIYLGFSDFKTQLGNVTNLDPFLASLLTVSSLNVSTRAGYEYSGNISLTIGNAKALGFDAPGSAYQNDPVFNCNPFTPPNGCDGIMKFGRDISWDFVAADGISPGTFDLEGVAMHEIGHALGFFSEVDSLDCVLNGGPVTGCGLLDPVTSGGPPRVNASVLDLYRFQNCTPGPGCSAPGTFTDFATAVRYLDTAGESIFSVVDQTYQLSRGFYTGDGRQASHWKDGLGIGLLDPTVAPGEQLDASMADRRGMQALGFVVVPEPGTWVMMSLGVAVLAVARRRKSRSTLDTSVDATDQVQ